MERKDYCQNFAKNFVPHFLNYTFVNKLQG